MTNKVKAQRESHLKFELKNEKKNCLFLWPKESATPLAEGQKGPNFNQIGHFQLFINDHANTVK